MNLPKKSNTGGASSSSPASSTPPPSPPFAAPPSPPSTPPSPVLSPQLPVTPPTTPPLSPVMNRNRLGLRPQDASLQAFRDSHRGVAPHSGAMFQDQYRKRPVSGYPGQSFAHDALRESASSFAAQSTDTAPITDLEAAMHMTAAQLHVTAPGPELRAGLTHGYSILDGIGSLKNDSERLVFSDNLHERREQVKANLDAAADHLPARSRKRMATASPQRETLARGGDYLSPPTSPGRPSFDTTDGASGPLSPTGQRNLARRILTPLMEPSWTPEARAAGAAPTPFYGSDIREVRDLFTAQADHTPEIGHAATARYEAGSGSLPTDRQVRVDAEPSDAFFGTKKRRLGAGAHEVVPTDRLEDIADLPDHARPAMAHAQADVRTNTSLTMFRSTTPAASSSSSSAAAAASSSVAGPPSGGSGSGSGH